LELITKEIPVDPAAPRFVLGKTLGAEESHWRRVKFGRYRLFFRFHTGKRVIVYIWLNDEKSLRKIGSKTDPYKVFMQRLKRGDPPDDWDDLMAKAKPLNLPSTKPRPKSDGNP
jgi:toxin YhaV